MGKTRNRLEYHCSNYGAVEPKLAGQCPSSGEWNTFEERTPAPRGRAQASAAPAGVVRLDGPSRPVARLVTGVNEFDCVAGGSLVPGSVMLLGGDPGVGKSIVLLQVLAALDADGIGGLYVSGEESIEQVRLRAQQRGRGAAGFSVTASTDAYTVADTLQSTTVIVFVATLGYSRRAYVQGFRHERQSAWFAGLEPLAWGDPVSRAQSGCFAMIRWIGVTVVIGMSRALPRDGRTGGSERLHVVE
jgi:hypothetical protein